MYHSAVAFHFPSVRECDSKHHCLIPALAALIVPYGVLVDAQEREAGEAGAAFHCRELFLCAASVRGLQSCHLYNGATPSSQAFVSPPTPERSVLITRAGPETVAALNVHKGLALPQGEDVGTTAQPPA